MVYNSYYNQSQSFDDSGKMAWDLRQFYARWVAKYMLDFKQAEDESDYPSMLKMLCRWHSSAKHEWSEDKTDDAWDNLKINFYSLANKNKNVYFRKSFDAEPIAKLEDHLQKMKEFLLYKMKNSNMFGATWNDDGL